METIREAFKKAMNLTKQETFVVDGKVQTNKPILPLPVSYCFEAISLILYVDACQRKGAEINNEILGVLQHNDITNLASMMQFLQLSGFLTWWFEQDAQGWEYDEEGNLTQNAWWEISEIIDSWNKYSETKGAIS